MSSGIYGVALSGLNAAQVGIRTTGQNLANVNTVGFSRQQVEQNSGFGQSTAVGFLGLGAQVTTVRRVYADYLVTQAQTQQAETASLDTLNARLGQLSNMVADPNANLGKAMDAFFAGAAQASASPSDPVSRQALLSSAQTLATRFSDLDNSFQNLQVQVNDQIRSTVDEVNGYARKIAALNAEIMDAGGTGASPNDMLDQRDNLIAELNQRVRAVTVYQGDQANVFLSNGQPLVLGRSALPIGVAADNLEPQKLVVGQVTPNGVQAFGDGAISGGSLGGILAFRDGALTQTRNQIGQLAMSFAHTVNNQLALGQDARGQPGSALFVAPQPNIQGATGNTGSAVFTAVVTDPAALDASDYHIEFDGTKFVVTRMPPGMQTSFLAFPQDLGGITVDYTGTPAAGDRFLLQPTRAAASQIKVALSDASQLGLAAPVRTAVASSNLGNATVKLAGVDVPDPNLREPVTLTFTSPTTFDVSGTGTGNPTGLSYTPGMTVAFNGWRVTLDGSAASGDQLSVGPNTNGGGDNFNVLRLAAVAGAGVVNGQTLTAAFGQTVGALGRQAQEASIGLTAHQGLLDSAQRAVASVSGVNLDEEAANLLRYQQAYQAAGKVISVANTLFDSLLQSVN